MKRTELIIAGIALLILGCKHESPITKEAWIEKPVSQWPSFALTNEIGFEDTTFSDLANSFIVSTGYDTLGVSCKHIFMVFENQLGLETIDLGSDFKYWKLYPKNDKGNYIFTKRLINKDPQEIIGQFNTLKVRDWILFEIDNQKTRVTQYEKDNCPIIYFIGWSTAGTRRT